MDEEKEMLPRDLEEEAVESEIVEETGKTKAPTWRPQDADRVYKEQGKERADTRGYNILPCEAEAVHF